MSNCVTLHTALAISMKKIDGARLVEDINEFEANDPSCPAWDTDDDTSYYLWWFLGSGNVRVKGTVLIIALGRHRSTHTWRDLRGTEKFLSRYLLVDKIKSYTLMSDESDGFRQVYHGKVVIER